MAFPRMYIPGSSWTGIAPGASPFDGPGAARQILERLMAYQQQPQFDPAAFDEETQRSIDDYQRQSRAEALMRAGAALLGTTGDPAAGFSGAASAFADHAGGVRDYKSDYTSLREEQKSARSREGYQDLIQQAYAASNLIPQATPPQPKPPTQDELDRQSAVELLQDPGFVEQIRQRYPGITDSQIQALAMDPVAMRQYLQPPEPDKPAAPPASSELMNRIRLRAMQGDPEAIAQLRAYEDATSGGGGDAAERATKMYDQAVRTFIGQGFSPQEAAARAAAVVTEAMSATPGGGGQGPGSGPSQPPAGGAEADAKRLFDAGISVAQAVEALKNDYPGEDIESIVARLWGRGE